MIEIKSLSKRINSKKILNNINFSVNKGEILGFLGPNGAGKTTTLKIITGFWKPKEGSVFIDGKDINHHSIEARKKIGYLPEHVPLYDDFKVFEYLKFVAEIRGIEKNEIINRIKEVAKLCGLEKVIGQSIDELSKGYRQRVGLAQAIMHNPEILILDEPTTGLDPNQIVEIRELIKNLGKEKTVIFSTHILAEASAVCDRIIIINKGQIVGQGSPAELSNIAGKNEIIYLKIKGPKERIKEILEKTENVISVEEKDIENHEIYGFNVQPQTGVDIRENLFENIIKHNWKILEMTRHKANLEDAFKQLTTK